jgi:hypothetical protein
MGFATVTLETASVLKEAIALYKHYGFVPAPATISPLAATRPTSSNYPDGLRRRRGRRRRSGNHRRC